MDLSRRQFLSGAAAAAGLAAMASSTCAWPFLPRLTGNLGRLTLDMLTHSHFEKCLGTRFQLRLESGESTELELIEATLHPASHARRGGPDRAPFSLVFRAPPSANLPQKIYSLTHDALGILDIFLVPIGPDERGPLLEAVFN